MMSLYDWIKHMVSLGCRPLTCILHIKVTTPSLSVHIELSIDFSQYCTCKVSQVYNIQYPCLTTSSQMLPMYFYLSTMDLEKTKTQLFDREFKFHVNLILRHLSSRTLSMQIETSWFIFRYFQYDIKKNPLFAKC